MFVWVQMNSVFFVFLRYFRFLKVMLFSVTKIKTLRTQTVPSQPTQPKNNSCMLRMPMFVSSNGSNTSPSDAIKRTIPLFLRRQVQDELDKLTLLKKKKGWSFLVRLVDIPWKEGWGNVIESPLRVDGPISSLCLFFFKETWNRSRKLELHNKADFDNSLPPTIRGNLKWISASQSGYTGFTCHISTNYQCPKKNSSRRSTKHSLLLVGYTN